MPRKNSDRLRDLAEDPILCIRFTLEQMCLLNSAADKLDWYAKREKRTKQKHEEEVQSIQNRLNEFANLVLAEDLKLAEAQRCFEKARDVITDLLTDMRAAREGGTSLDLSDAIARLSELVPPDEQTT